MARAPTQAAEGHDPAAAGPRRTADLYGHGEIEHQILDAVSQGTLVHGLLFTGPQGLGKATMAYRLARFLLAGGEGAAGQGGSLAVSPEARVARQIADGLTQDLMIIERPWDEKKGTPKTQIPAEDVRKIVGFFSRTSGHGGYRVAIIDAIDHLNRFGQNALLKTLEEPPPRCVLILISHNPGRVLPTIFSRCRRFSFHPLSADDMRAFLAARADEAGFAMPDTAALNLICALTGHAPGRALALVSEGGLDLFKRLMDLLSDWPALREGAVFGFADQAARGGAGGLELTAMLLSQILRRAALAAAGAPSPAPLPGFDEQIARLAGGASAEAWSRAWQGLNEHFEAGIGLNADPRQIVVEALRLVKAPKDL